MTVIELIAKLQKLPQNAEVYVAAEWDSPAECVFARGYVNGLDKPMDGDFVVISSTEPAPHP